MSDYGIKCFDANGVLILDTSLGLSQIVKYVNYTNIISTTSITIAIPGLDPNKHDVYIYADFYSWVYNPAQYPTQSANPTRVYTLPYNKSQGYIDLSFPASNPRRGGFTGSTTINSNSLTITNTAFPTTTAEWSPSNDLVESINNLFVHQNRHPNFHIYVVKK